MCHTSSGGIIRHGHTDVNTDKQIHNCIILLNKQFLYLDYDKHWTANKVSTFQLIAPLLLHKHKTFSFQLVCNNEYWQCLLRLIKSTIYNRIIMLFVLHYFPPSIKLTRGWMIINHCELDQIQISIIPRVHPPSHYLCKSKRCLSLWYLLWHILRSVTSIMFKTSQ